MINIDVYRNRIWKTPFILSKTEMKKIVQKCLDEVSIDAKDVFLNVSFVNSKQMIAYNLKYRGEDSSTNVLSFENRDYVLKHGEKNKKYKTIFLGEIVLCFEKIQHEANEFNKSFNDRLYHLFVHGIFHLLGYNHIKNNERKEMELLETNVLLKFKINNPYNII